MLAVIVLWGVTLLAFAVAGTILSDLVRGWREMVASERIAYAASTVLALAVSLALTVALATVDL